MKLALLLPGYLDSPDYLHKKTFEKGLIEMGYTVERLDPCHLWETGDVNNYTITNYIAQIHERIEFYKNQHPEEVALIGHSLGAFISILAGKRFPEITRIVVLCPTKSIDGLGTKWKGGAPRISKRDLPEDRGRYREFIIPYEFVRDAKTYSAFQDIRGISKPLMIYISLADESINPSESEKLVSQALHPYVIRMPGMGHNFRYSQKETDSVWGEIKKFLTS